MVFLKLSESFSGYFDKASKYSIPTEVLGKVIVYNATNKKPEAKVEILEHPDLLKLALEAVK